MNQVYSELALKSDPALRTDDDRRRIYRMMRLDYFLQMLRDKRWVVPKVSSWDDSWESFFLKQDFLYGEDRVVTDELQSHLYGQSWTLANLDNTDVLWRCYNHSGCFMYVAVGSSVEKVRSLLHSQDDKTLLSESYLGRVSYLSNRKISEFISDNNVLSSGQQIENLIVKSLFVKRKPFAYEKEFRLVIWPDKGTQPLFELPLNGVRIVDEVILDPRMADSKYTSRVENITDMLKCAGFDDRVRISKLFSFFPKKRINL